LGKQYLSTIPPGQPAGWNGRILVARTFRFWLKKRGARRTGSPLAGSVGEAVFFALQFLLGSISLAAVITSQVLHPTPNIYRPGEYGFWLMVLVMVSFVVMGGAGVLFTAFRAGASAERRSAIVKQASGIDLISNALPSTQSFPCVPRDAHLRNSPGVVLAYRLPSAQIPGWRLTVATLVFLILTAVVSALGVIVVNQHLAGRPDWFLTLFVVPLAMMDAWSVRYFFMELSAHARYGQTCVEISHHPLHPNHDYEIFVSQSGRFSFPSFSVSLVCEEEASYSQGTDIRAEKRVVFKEEILRRESVRIDAGSPFEVTGTLSVPDSAMHSFQSGHNAVRWKLVVTGTSAKRQTMSRSFPVIVQPESKDAQPVT